MSRFDDELIKQADNAYQMRGLPEPTTPGINYDQTSNLNLDGPFGLSSQAPAPVDEVADWIANTPAVRTVDVQDLDAADEGEIVGGPGSSAVYAEGGPVYATKDPIDESLYNVYRASREIRDAIEDQVDFDFSNLMTAANDASTVFRFASANDEVNQIIGTVASIVTDIETDLATNGDYRQASADLEQLESLLEDINKLASASASDDDECKNCKGAGCDMCKSSKKKKDKKKDKKKASRTEWCTGEGCKIKECDGKKKPKEATNGNQETLQIVDVRDLDDQAGVWDKEKVMTPDHVTNVEVPEEVNGEDAGYVPFYNDGSETGIEPGNGPHHQQIDFNDATNPALAPYAGTVAAVQASREKIFESLQIVERLEKLGMVQHDDRAKHIAKFEQMSDAKLAGFKASLDMLEESGARQPRSQKVASGSNRLPEMGRMTTASTVTRQDLLSDDWLMTLN
jgi:hypothetical protein